MSSKRLQIALIWSWQEFAFLKIVTDIAHKESPYQLKIVSHACGGKGGWMPKVSAKHVQRRIADLDAQYTVAQPKRRGRRVVALIILAVIAVAAFSIAVVCPAHAKTRSCACHVGVNLNRTQKRPVRWWTLSKALSSPGREGGADILNLKCTPAKPAF